MVKTLRSLSSGMDADDAAYRRSVRNTAIVLSVVVVVLAASLGLTLLFDVAPDTFQTKTSVASTFPFTLTLTLNSTTVSPAGGVTVSAFLNGTGTGNVTAVSSWAFVNSSLWVHRCGWPLGIGIMQGHYTLDNYSLGTLLQPRTSLDCAGHPVPRWFYFGSQASKVLVTLGGTPAFWELQTLLPFNANYTGQQSLPPGVYTAVAADEWGDFVLTNFRVS